MYIDAEALTEERIQSEIAVIGAGPAGISVALEFARLGHEVTLIESGSNRFSARTQTLGDAALGSARQAPMSESTRRLIGGASAIWGGRCVPYDPIDFANRSYIPHSRWPVTFEDIAPYFEKTSDYFRSGRAVFNLHQIKGRAPKSIVPGLPDGDILSSDLERWSLPTHFGREYHKELSQNPRIRVLHSLTCTEIELDPNGTHVKGFRCKTSHSGRPLLVLGRVYALACGGVETTRLLLASNRVHTHGIGGQSGHLGRFYMGHISGRVARVRFSTPPRKTVYGFDRDIDGTYLRRRFSFSAEFQEQKKLTNVTGSLVNPDIADPSHRNGVLSFAYLALASPAGRFFVADALRKAALESDLTGPARAHLRNILLDPLRTLSFIPSFGYKRFVAHRKVPGFFQYSHSNQYLLHYHGEQVPNPNSCIELGSERDALGMRRVKIDLRYTAQDVDGVVRAHQYWDEYLRRHGVGALEYLSADVSDSVWKQAGDGFHQVGTTRMSDAPSDGVVDAQGQIHGVDNLFVASSSNLVTSSQANSTFMIVAFALRMIDHIRNGSLLR